MYEVGVVSQFEAAHRLSGDFGPARRVHGHTYRVEVAVRGSKLSDDGALFDIGVLKNLVDEALAQVNYQFLNDLAVFQGRNSTAEVVARWLYDLLASELGGMALSVRIWESPSAFAAYDGVY